MLNVKNAIDNTIASLKTQGVAPQSITLNLVRRTLLSAQLQALGLHDGLPEQLNQYEGLPVHIDANPSGLSAVGGRRPGLAASVSQLLVQPVG